MPAQTDVKMAPYNEYPVWTVSMMARDALEGVDNQFIERWSPRAYAPHKLEQQVLARIIDAARWAPSCYNEQPWLFHTSNEQNFHEYLALLVEFNQSWAKRASVIGFLVGNRQFSSNGKANDHSRFDCGAAWMSLALQSGVEGLYAHGMAGFDKAAAEKYLDIDTDKQDVIMAFTIGKIGDKAELPENLQEKELPSDRKSLTDIWVSR